MGLFKKVINIISSFSTPIALIQFWIDTRSQKKDAERSAEVSLQEDKKIELLERIDTNTDPSNDSPLDYKVRYIGGPPRSTFGSRTGTTYIFPHGDLVFGAVRQSGVIFSKIFVISRVKKHYNINNQINLQQLYYSPRNTSSRNKDSGILIGKNTIEGSWTEVGHNSKKQSINIKLFPADNFLRPKKWKILHLIFFSKNNSVQLITILLKIGRKQNGKIVAGHKNGGSEIKDECLIFNDISELQNDILWHHQLSKYLYSSDEKNSIIEICKMDALDSCKNIQKYLNDKGTTVQYF